MKKTVLRTTFSLILSLFLAFGILATCLCVFAETTICQSAVLTDTASSCGYGEELYKEIEYDWSNLIAIAGVPEPEQLMTDLTVELVKADAIAYLESSYTGKSTLNTDALQDKLEEKVRQYAYSNTIHETPEEELEKHIDELVTACIQDYNSAVEVPLLPRILGSVGTIQRYVSIGKYAGIGFSVVVLVLLFFLQKKRADILYYTAISAATNAVLLIGAMGMAEKQQIVARLPVEASALKTLLSAYVQTLFDRLESYGYICLIVAAVLVALWLLWLGFVRFVEKRKNTQTA